MSIRAWSAGSRTGWISGARIAGKAFSDVGDVDRTRLTTLVTQKIARNTDHVNRHASLCVYFNIGLFPSRHCRGKARGEILRQPAIVDVQELWGAWGEGVGHFDIEWTLPCPA